MPKQIIWSPSAEKDIAGILEYLHIKWDEKVVLHFIDLTNKTIEQLSVNPINFL